MSEELINASMERIADLLEPINGGVGEDVSYDEKFDELKAESDKLSSLDGSLPNWSNMLVVAEEVLQDKSKDFRVVCYWCCAKMREDLNGFLDGCLLMEQTVEKFWDDMFPPIRRMRARAGMLAFMSDNVGPVAIDFKLKASDGDMVKLLEDKTKALDATLREKMGDHYPSLAAIRDASRHWQRSVPKEEKKPEPKKEEPKQVEPKQEATAAAAPAPAAPARAPAAAAPAVQVASVTASGADEAMKALGTLGRELCKMSVIIRGEKLHEEAAYRFNRIGAWAQLTKTPPSPAGDGKTLVPPPRPNLKAGMENLASSQDWMKLIEVAENHCANNILWLDPHRYVATGMAALGPMFEKARQAVLVQTALMLQRVPKLPKLQFNDGTPFADGPTQMWIENDVLTALATEGGGGGGGAPSVYDEPMKEAQGMAVKGELDKALGVIAAAASAAPTPAERFKGKLYMAQLCLGATKYAIARSQYEGLTSMIDEHHLETWDPSICAEVYGGLYASLKAINSVAKPQGNKPPVPGAAAPPGPLPEDVEAEKRAFEKLCQLNPAEALKLSGK